MPYKLTKNETLHLIKHSIIISKRSISKHVSRKTHKTSSNIILGRQKKIPPLFEDSSKNTRERERKRDSIIISNPLDFALDKGEN